MRLACGLVLLSVFLLAQTDERQVRERIGRRILAEGQVEAELKQYLMARVPQLRVPEDARTWTGQSRELRRRVLEEVILRGWPKEWVNAPLRVEEAGEVGGGDGYTMRKLRLEIVPGFWTTAIVYEPRGQGGKLPAILNVNGHVGEPGKAVEYKQKRCIQLARHGVVALNIEWIGCGELFTPENVHWFAAHIDLAGANAAGIFYLAMRKGLDYLESHPRVDKKRLGMTGLSGGGWQTIVLSSLDERVLAAAPVAGYASMTSRIERVPGEPGDVEQNATDLLTLADYPHLTAIRAPRPTMLIYNAEDDCCFRAPMVKTDIFDRVKPFFRLYGAGEQFGWHLNTDPSNHNYQLDNREQAYKFFSKALGIRPAIGSESGVEAGIRSYEDLRVGLPERNLTLLGLARRLAAREQRGQPQGPLDAKRLSQVVRYRPVEVARAWAVANTYSKGMETRSYRLEFSNALSAGAVWLRALGARPGGELTVIVEDKGRAAGASEIADRVNRGEQVLALEPVFTGEAGSARDHLYAEMLGTLGERAIGVRAAQIAAAARWAGQEHKASFIRLHLGGMRAQAAGLIAAAMVPDAFSEVRVEHGIDSFATLLAKPVSYLDAPEMFCLDLLREFDLPVLAAARKERAGLLR